MDIQVSIEKKSIPVEVCIKYSLSCCIESTNNLLNDLYVGDLWFVPVVIRVIESNTEFKTNKFADDKHFSFTNKNREIKKEHFISLFKICTAFTQEIDNLSKRFFMCFINDIPVTNIEQLDETNYCFGDKVCFKNKKDKFEFIIEKDIYNSKTCVLVKEFVKTNK